MTEKILFTADELQLITEKDFFLTKKRITEKLQLLFGRLNEQIHITNTMYADVLPVEITAIAGKISKGENYRGFPWMVLDNPRVFGKEDVFAFRSMFWWGNEISFTLHLSGKYLAVIHDAPHKLQELLHKNYFFNVNSTPWEYHFEPENYRSLEDALQEDYIPHTRNFIKLSRKMSLEYIDDIPEHGIAFYKEMLRVFFDQRLPIS
jgi:hypothetical protein